MWIEPINCDEFLKVVGPALNRACPDELARRVEERWTVHQLCPLLQHDCVDMRRITCVVLGLVGDGRVLACLAAALRDEDEQVNQLAEHALWSLWFRAGEPQAQLHFKRGLEALESECGREAVRCFHAAHQVDPGFAESFNQCSIAHYLLDEWDASLEMCRQTIELMPIHFGALAGMGHCHAQRGELGEAAACYRRALRVNPRMAEIAAALQRIDQALGPACETSPSASEAAASE